MGRKIWVIAISFILVIVIGFAVWDCLLWRCFGFRFCENPKYLLSSIEVEDDVCGVTFTAEYGGNSASAHYNDIIYEFNDGVLKIGAHKSISLGASTEISEEITVESCITEVRLCGSGKEMVIWTARE